jgi:hypothetical protein
MLNQQVYLEEIKSLLPTLVRPLIGRLDIPTSKEKLMKKKL